MTPHLFHPLVLLPASSVGDRISRFVFITQNVAHDTVAELYNFFNSSQEVAQ
ncbi:hypothetical protein [Vreelandella janggokensis]|uniref:hypothetical protein n=1 Tax=Vreelandella janggokensis TaxID=370767 RepID=UPI00285DFF9C|nr:hypothetical protein [Halomonas janggokensis]MDR5886005.1 hypothetical protein [Halomonas janggokensis]